MMYLLHALCYKLETKKWKALSHCPCPYRAYSLWQAQISKQMTVIQCDKCYDRGRNTEGAIRTKRWDFQGGFPGNNSLSVSGYAIIALGRLSWIYHLFPQSALPSIYITPGKEKMVHTESWKLSSLSPPPLQVLPNFTSLYFKSTPYSLFLL